MKIKLDENLPASLAAVLSNLSHDVHTIAQEGLSGSSDRDVWDATQRDERFLITQDLDFSDLRRFIPGNTSRHPTGAAPFSGSEKPNPPPP